LTAGSIGGVAGCLGGGNGGNGNGDGGNGDGSSGNGNGDGGNGDGDDTSNQGGEVHYLTDYNNEEWQNRWEDEITPRFEEEYDWSLRVEYTGLQGKGRNRLATLRQSGDSPEVFTAGMYQIGDLLLGGSMESVSDVVDELEDSLGSMMGRSSIQVGGEDYLMPHGAYAQTFVYRQDIYDELGLEVPETWDELIENARAIDEADDIEARGYGLSAVREGKVHEEFSNYLRNAGGGRYRWADGQEGEEAEIWVDQDHAYAVLDLFEELMQYSPDPTSISWTPFLDYWSSGRIAQGMHLNAQVAGVAYSSGEEEIARNTGVARIPMREGADPIDRGRNNIDGHAVISEAEATEGAKQLHLDMYADSANAADIALIEPMRFIPPFLGLLEQEEYQQAEIFQVADGHFLDLNQTVLNDIMPYLEGGDEAGDRARTAATIYTNSFPIEGNLVNGVLIQERDRDEVYEETISMYEERLAEGKELASDS
jgi:multiple sugar transport system substrate-binding protein